MVLQIITIVLLATLLTLYIIKNFYKKKETVVAKPIKDNSDKVRILLGENAVDKINLLVDTLIKDAADKYMILNINFDKDAYLNSKAIDRLSSYIFGMVKKNMTDTVRETIGIIHDIETEDKLDEFLRLRIKIYVLALAVKTNQPL